MVFYLGPWTTTAVTHGTLPGPWITTAVTHGTLPDVYILLFYLHQCTLPRSLNNDRSAFFMVRVLACLCRLNERFPRALAESGPHGKVTHSSRAPFCAVVERAFATPCSEITLILKEGVPRFFESLLVVTLSWDLEILGPNESDLKGITFVMDYGVTSTSGEQTEAVPSFIKKKLKS